jgi:hypothetical protein
MSSHIIQELQDGLIIRHSTGKDTEALTAFNILVHSESDSDKKGLEDWTRDLISGEGPTFDTGDFTIVEDTKTGEIISSSCLISQTWSYEGIPFKVGRLELVGTKEDYRRKGLIRRQFEILHAWSKQRGELVQVVEGIPFYYRQFGYEMTLNVHGGRIGYEIHVPKLKNDQQEPYSIRLAVEEDIPFLMKTCARGFSRSMIHAIWDQDLWRYELTGKRKLNINRREIYIIEDLEGRPAGFTGIPSLKWGNNIVATQFEIASGYAWTEITPSVIRFRWETGLRQAEEQGEAQQMFGFWLGEDHPVYQVAATLLPRIRKPYAHFVRVPDVPAFIEHIKPALEKRLARSAFVNYTGEIKLNFYRDGLSLKFAKGQLEEINALHFTDLKGCEAAFPPLVFLNLIFGYRRMEELIHIYPDCSVRDDETMYLLDALFPRKPSAIWGIS